MVFVIFTEDLQKDTSLSTFFSRFLPMAAEYCDFDSRSLPGQVVFTNLLRGTEVSEEAKTRFLLRLGQSDEYRLCLVRNLTVRNYTQRSLLINELTRQRCRLRHVNSTKTLLFFWPWITSEI